MIIIAVGLLFLLRVCICQVNPDEYIIEVNADCPSSRKDGPARIVVTTDLPSSKPFAVCNNGEYLFRTNVLGTWELSVYFPDQINSECHFRQKSNESYVYIISVYIPLSDKVLTVNVPEKIVSCIYDPMGVELSAIQELDDSAKPAKQIQAHMVVESAARIVVCVANIADECMKGKIRTGNKIKLKATLISDNPTETGFKTLACTAVGIKQKYPLLIGGCGDGRLIPKNLGFTTTGRVALSPVFKAFRLPGGKDVTYECSFVVCSGGCDGSSCTQGKITKRDTLAVREKHHSETLRIPKDRVLSQMMGGEVKKHEPQLQMDDKKLRYRITEKPHVSKVSHETDSQSVLNPVKEIRRHGPNPTDDGPFLRKDMQIKTHLVSTKSVLVLLLAAMTLVFMAAIIKLVKMSKHSKEKERDVTQFKSL